MASGLPRNGSIHSQKANVCSAIGSMVKDRDFQLVSSISEIEDCGAFAAIQAFATAWTASSPVTCTRIPAEAGGSPSTISRLPIGARNGAPRLLPICHPRPGSNPRAAKKPESCS